MALASPLQAEIAAAGASLVERDGWLVGVDFGDAPAEYAAARSGLAMADRSSRAWLTVTGRDAAKLLQNLLSNDVDALVVGSSCDALLLTPKGRPQAELRVLRSGEEAFLLDGEPATHEVVTMALRRYRLASRADIVDARGEIGAIALLGGDPPAPPTGTWLAAGLLGADLVGPADTIVAAWQALLADGRVPIGADVVEVLRIEAGRPRLGADYDEAVLPAEAGVVERTISFTKGCYVGQEPVARLQYRGHANRRLARLSFDDLPSLPAELVEGARVVGRVTSVARRPGVLAAAVGLGYVRRGVADGAQLEAVAADGHRRHATVVPAAEGSPAAW